ncbi:hypothetical protein [Algoriphagus confluentis]
MKSKTIGHKGTAAQMQRFETDHRRSAITIGPRIHRRVDSGYRA